MQKRQVWADIVRILAIYLIIVLHVAKIPENLSKRLDVIIILAIINTCVPLLVMLSGALILGKAETYKVFFQKRLSRILLPWIGWTSIFTAIVTFYNHYSPSSVLQVFHSIFIPLFWFIPMILGLYLLTPALRILIKNAKIRDVLFLISVWFVAVSILPFVRNTQAFPASTDNGLVRLVVGYSGYFILGYLIVKELAKKQIKIPILLFCLGLFLTLATNFNILHFMDLGFLSPGIVLITISIFSLVYLSEDRLQMLLSNRVKKILAIISKTTLGIFFVHFLFINRPPLPGLLGKSDIANYYVSLDPFLNGAIIFVLSFFIVFLLQQVPVVKRFIA